LTPTTPGRLVPPKLVGVHLITPSVAVFADPEGLPAAQVENDTSLNVGVEMSPAAAG
jgi:hypothetical protein